MNLLLLFVIIAFIANSIYLYVRDQQIYYHKIPNRFKIAFLGLTLISLILMITGQSSIFSLDTLFLIAFGLFTLTSGNME